MTESATAVRVVRQADFEPRWNSPRADEPGFGRAFIEGVSATNFMVNILVLPPGQGCPRHDFGGDVVVLALAGQVEFVVHDGGSSTAYTLEPNDMLLLPAGRSVRVPELGARAGVVRQHRRACRRMARQSALRRDRGEVVVHGSTAKEPAE